MRNSRFRGRIELALLEILRCMAFYYAQLSKKRIFQECTVVVNNEHVALDIGDGLA